MPTPARRLPPAAALGAALAVPLAVPLLVPPATAVADTAAPAAVPAGTYVLDPSHSTLVFRVSHLGFSFYTASFDDFDATLRFDPGRPEESALDVRVDVASLRLPTPPAGFREELLGPAWLDAGAHPEMSFVTTSVEPREDGSLRADGELTLRGETRPVALDVTFNGGYAGLPGLDPRARAGFSARGTLRRSDFGIDVGVPAPGSDFGVGDTIELLVEAEFSGPPLADPPDPPDVR